jgi:hypothetical protein
MLRDDEENMGLSCRPEWHIELRCIWERGTFCCNTLNMCCRTTAKVGARNLKGVSLGWGK